MTDNIRPTRPRLRTAAIVWGLILAGLGAGAAWLTLDPHRVSDIGLWLLAATPGDAAIVLVAALLVVGLVILIGSLLSVLHRAQERRRQRPAASDPAQAPTP